MSITTLFLVVLLVIVIMGLPNVGPSWHSWGYAPSSILAVVLVICLVLMLLGRL